MGPGTLIASRFELQHLAGEGGMGAVYRAHDRLTGNTVAVKVLTHVSEDCEERFMREARALAELNHAAVVGHLDHGRTHDDRAYLVMEWLEGEELSTRLARESISISETLAMLKRVAEGLGAAHSRGVVHRDVKPGNIFLVGGDAARAKLLDFGIAHLAGAVRSLTRTGALIGTPAYMAPEQARGERDIDARADVFALGCIAYRCLTGRRPFQADDIMAVAVKLLLEEPPPVDELRPEVPRGFSDLVMRMLAKEKDARPRDGHEVARLLEGIEDTSNPGAPPARTSAPSPSAITDAEQRFIGVIVAESENSMDATTIDRTFIEPAARRKPAPLSLEAIAAQYGARIEQLHGDTVVATLTFRSGGTEEVAKAARVALALRALMPLARLALVTGRGLRAGRLPLGDALEQAVGLVRASAAANIPAGTILLDEATAQLLAQDFEISASTDRWDLVGARHRVPEAPRLLGRPTQCVGRERELSTLAVALDECVDEATACTVILTAAPGMGKTRLLNEFVTRARKRDGDLELWFASGDAGSPGSPFAIVRRLLRSALGDAATSDHTLRRALAERVVDSVAPADAARVTAFLTELVGLPRTAEDELLLPRDSPVLMGDHMQRAFEDFLSAECTRHPVVLVVDDLQWGDGPSVRLLDGALRRLRDAALLVLAAGRPELETAFPALWHERAPMRLPIGPLSKKASENVIKNGLGADTPQDIVAALAARAEGNALYLEELVRAHAHGKTDVPATVLLSVQARLDDLDASVRRVLRAASVFGASFWRGGVLALVGGAEDTLAEDALTHLGDRELIAASPSSRFAGHEQFTFRHALFREAAYATLTQDDRALAHRLAGAWLEKAGERDANVLADHYERGGEKESAVRWLIVAAEEALAGNDFRGVLRRVDRGLACNASGENRGRLELAAAEAERWLGGSPEVMLWHSEEAFRLLERGTPAWQRAGAELVLACRRLEQLHRCIATVETLEQESADASLSPAVAEALAATAAELMYGGRHAEADALLVRFERLRAASDDPLVQMHWHYAMSEKATIAGDLSESIRHDTLALETSLERGDLRDLARRRSNVAHGYTELGAYELAQEELRQAEAAAERLGLAHLGAVIHMNLGWALLRASTGADLTAPRRLIEGAARDFARMEHARFEAAAVGYLAHVHLREGDAVGAEAVMNRVLQLDLPTGELPFVLATRAMARLAQGRTAEALADARRGEQILDEQGSIPEGEVIVRLAAAQALFSVGQTDEARTAVRKACDVVRSTAAKITDERLRESYLTRVSENARALELERSWTETR